MTQQNSHSIYDTIIIGAGPGGMTAGIYAARREMKTLIIGKEPGGQIMWASEIENYPGFKSIDNYELISRMQEQVSSLGVNLKMEGVTEINKENDIFSLKTEKDTYQARTVIITMGLAPRKLNVPGEEEFIGKGISYCANCDGPFYKNKTVGVVGGGNSAMDAAEVLSKIAEQVYLIHRREEFKAFAALTEEVKKKDNVELVLNSEIKEISGEEKLNKVTVLNNQTQQEKELEMDGLFIEIGRVAHTDWLAEWVERDEADQIKADKKCQTKTPGLFAAGDVKVDVVVPGSPKAVGDPPITVEVLICLAALVGATVAAVVPERTGNGDGLEVFGESGELPPQQFDGEGELIPEAEFYIERLAVVHVHSGNVIAVIEHMEVPNIGDRVHHTPEFQRPAGDRHTVFRGDLRVEHLAVFRLNRIADMQIAKG